jgi:hypothetical protein
MPILSSSNYNSSKLLRILVPANGTLCVHSHDLRNITTNLDYYFDALCVDVAGGSGYGLSPGASPSLGYNKLSLAEDDYQWYLVGCTISILSIFIALYYYRLELVQLQTTYVYFIQVLFFIGLTQNSYLTSVQNLLSGFAFANIHFFPNFFYLANQVSSSLFNKNFQVLDGSSYIYAAGSSISALIIVLFAFLVLFLL